jgi:hypothetical protein
MIYSVFLYIIFVLPISIFYYKQDGRKFLVVKILNTFITFYIFILFSGNLKRLILSFSDSAYLIMRNVPLVLNYTLSFIYGVLSFITVIQAVRIAFRKESARIFFIRMIPILWVLTSIDYYYISMTIYKEVPSLLHEVLINIFYGLIWMGVFFIYRSKKFKLFFNVPLSSAESSNTEKR